MLEHPPGPGTLSELLGDADALGLPQLTERQVQEWKRLGLVGAPQRVSLGRGHGQAPAVYSSEQRALFRAVVRHRAHGVRNETLARLPVWAWLTWGDDWVNLDQLRRALRTSLGPNPRKSARAANEAARRLVASVEIPGADRASLTRLRGVLAGILVGGPAKADLDRLRRAVEVAFTSAGGVHLVAGPLNAPLHSDAVSTLLEARIRAVRHIDSFDDDAFERARRRHQVEWANYRAVAPALSQEAGPRMATMFEDTTTDDEVNEAVSTLLLHLGIGLLEERRREATR